MNNSLNGKVVAVTGGFGALGSTAGKVLATRGMQVVLLGREAAPHLSEESGNNLIAIGGVDLASPAQTRQAFAEIKTRFGRLDALVNIAGGFRWELIAGGSADTWDLMYQMNVKTVLTASEAAIPFLLENGVGRIVNISAMAALKAGLGMGAYSASKAGVARLTEALAEELKQKGVTVNAILPSTIDTARNRADMPDADFTQWVKPEQIGSIIAFLLSSDADAITGALLPVTGRG
ncbi:3-oxoacyl-[acyl-carrier-protein] reductase [Paraburkholderia acidicola]|uniref:3-oxoacyl-[acyl-carrier-protein] reductase n=1 Tax=Paraburkholderia acidicola TaxID=1912599 RepID=A0A2A4ESK1_9BURK|nr:SDR family NAD(P)-dependent oxidoreductase [Paraburkholderia acidicola]PCE23136.1 3-oxoacyl-[acyl-carrier-protein] reductase [Paraburkholderia acidicola]